MLESFHHSEKKHEEAGTKSPSARHGSEQWPIKPREASISDEATLLRKVETRARKYPQTERSFKYYEALLDRVLSDSPLESYIKARYSIKTDSDLPFLLLTD